VDVDVFIPSGELLSQVGPIGIQQNSEFYTRTGNLTTSVPGNIATDLTANNSSANGISPNLGINNGTGGSITFLDDFQVNFLLRATQISQNTTTLTAPRLTLFNGQAAYVAVSTDTAYVSDLTPVVANGAVAFDPTIGTSSSGVSMLVRATVSADRKYVTLTLQPTLQRLRSLVTFPISAIANTATNIGTGQTQITQAFIQQPVTDLTSLATTVSVPDGGTLLLGGQTLAGEIERESGIPILSKIPFLKRLFTNSSTAKDEQVLLILVKPTIVIQREKEQEQFPTLNSKL
jgi:type II secretory pathway component GspD/PulD (secretin)